MFQELMPDQPRQNLREFIDTLHEGGYKVTDGHTPDPVRWAVSRAASRMFCQKGRGWNSDQKKRQEDAWPDRFRDVAWSSGLVHCVLPFTRCFRGVLFLGPRFVSKPN